MNEQNFDKPIDNPDYDLLGMAGYAFNLAQFILDASPSFTIGIYGEWGSGKSSYVELLKYYLEMRPTSGETVKKLKFISFGAWDYTTADELWRALILKIALKLYDKPDDYFIKQQQENNQKQPSQGNGDSGASGLLATLAKFFQSKPFEPRKPPSPPGADDRFKEIIAEIDSKLYAKISRDPQNDIQLNQEATFVAILQGIMAALGAVSPLVSGIGKLFVRKDINPADLVQAGKNQASRETIQSIQEFRQLLEDYFKPVMQKERVVIFVDDLDRCLPNVALELLEAIKIFLGGLPCVFIIAADRQLVGQGLRLRYGELFSSGDPQKTEELLDRKGQEYFEKIIQFGIPVPPRTPQQAHDFISAQFPKWVAATDLIQTVVGTNPRRLKQYCQRLDFNYSVYCENRKPASQTADSWSEPKNLKLLERCIELNAWRKNCRVAMLGVLKKGPDSYRSRMERLEKWIGDTKEDEPLQKAREELSEPDCLLLYDSAVSLHPLYQLFLSSPRFSELHSTLLEDRLRLAGIAPDPFEILSSEDAFFMRVLRPVFQNSSVQVDSLLQADLTRLLTLSDLSPELLDTLVSLAGHVGFNTEMKRVEARLEGKLPQDETIDADFQLLVDQLGESQNQQVKDLLLGKSGTPRFSDMLRQEILLLKDTKRDKKSQEENTPLARPSLGELEEFINSLPEDKLNEVKTAINLRIDLARYYFELRKFAKLRGLEDGWQKLHQRLLTNRKEVIDLEDVIAPIPDTQAPDVQVSDDLQLYLKEKQLRDFLHLRPRLSKIDVGELEDYAAIMETIPAVQATPISEVSPPPPTVAVKEFLATTQPPFDIFSLVIRQKAKQLGEYDVTAISTLGKTQASIIVDWPKFYKRFLYTQESAPVMARSTSQPPQRNVSLEPAIENFRWYQLTLEQIREVGTLIYNQFFPDELNNSFISVLGSPERDLRMIFDLDENDSDLRELPWETLFIPRLRLHPVLNLRYELMRLAKPSKYLQALEIIPPLRILAVLSSPKDLPPLNISGEREILQRALASAIERSTVELNFVEPATTSRLQELIRSFRPHLVHFVVHGEFNKDNKTGYLALEDENGVHSLLNAEDIKILLADSDVRAVVLNGCETSTALGSTDYTSSVAGNLLDAGVPFVIGTMRPIADESALLFSREFYRSFAEGFSLEYALTEARKALSIEKYDWSAYAFYTISAEIESFRIARGSFRTERGEEKFSKSASS